VDVPGRLADAGEFGDIIVKVETDESGRITRLKDVARVELGAQTYSQSFTQDGEPAAGLAIFQLPEANALDVATAVAAAVERLSKNFPPGLVYGIPFDTTTFVRAAVAEVWRTLFIAAGLVLIVIMVFVQDWRAVLVPATTVPVTIIGAFAALAAMGFGINLITLFAIVLAIGIVVDDAIVVVEGAARHIERGLSPKDAAIAAMKDLFGPIVGITLVLMSVFLPAAFLPGISGQMYRQFALVMAATALISAINAATLKPTQCALWLRPVRPHRGWFARGFERVYGAAERGFVGLITRMVRQSLFMTIVGIGLGGVAVWGLAKLPTSFIPIEDQGYMVVGVLMPQGASLQRTNATLAKVTKIMQDTPGVEQVVTIGGISVLDNNASLANAGAAYVILEPWGERGKGEDLAALFTSMTDELGQLEEAVTYVLIPPPIQGVGVAAGFQMETLLRDQSFDYEKLQNVTREIVRSAATQSGLRFVVSPFQAGAPQLQVTVNRDKAETLGVQVGDVFEALQTFLGSTYINQFNRFGRTFQVFAQADQRFRLTPDEINRLYVRNNSGDMVPLGTMVEIGWQAGSSLINLYDLRPAAQIIGIPDLDFSTGQAMDLLAQIADDVLPTGMGYEWTGISYQEDLVGDQAYFVFALALVLVYLALAAQYESWLIPVAVLLAVPIAVLGTASPTICTCRSAWCC
jgi:HAE1 family hydrophobic/amphiphilic exporter-1